MKTPPRRTVTLVLALLSSAGLVAQKGGAGGAELTVSVTVAPICTVAITPGEWSAERAIDVRCRNLAISQPQPVITHTVIETTEEGTAGSSNDAAMVVINF